MKIDMILERVILAAEKSQPSDPHRAREEIQKQAVAAMAALPQNQKKWAKAKELERKCDKYYTLTEELFASLGVQYGVIKDPFKFKRAGGIVPEPVVHWRADNLLARIAAAETQEEVVEILKRHGINWK